MPIAELHIHQTCVFCLEICDATCTNRWMAINCTKASCNIKNDCTNRLLQTKPMLTGVFKTRERGIGLCAIVPIAAQEYIQEYIGEYKHATDKNRRSKYMYQATTDYIIDAATVGNTSRFINHSCDPNCDVVKRVANGLTRLLVIANQDIAKDEELTINYDPHRNGRQHHDFQCLCGSPDCRRFI